MTFKTEQIYLAAFQQARIRRTMGRMAGDTPLGPYRSMLKCERTCFVGVAGKAYLVLRRRSPQLVRIESAMGIVAIAAGNQAFIHFMMERFGKIGFLLLMAGEAERGFCRLQELVFHLG
ncbi:MAG TPA: hypothetical protein VK699_07090 [Terriglobales bacterium]|nr:hypothetical protein [Terriglobales bacterium]